MQRTATGLAKIVLGLYGKTQPTVWTTAWLREQFANKTYPLLLMFSDNCKYRPQGPGVQPSSGHSCHIDFLFIYFVKLTSFFNKSCLKCSHFSTQVSTHDHICLSLAIMACSCKTQTQHTHKREEVAISYRKQEYSLPYHDSFDSFKQSQLFKPGKNPIG